MADNTDSQSPGETQPAEASATKTASKSTKSTTAAKTASKRGGAAKTTRRTTSQARTAGTSRRDTTAPSGIGAVGSYAERAVLIPVGAALIARERLISGVSDVISSYSTPKKTQAQLHRFERRGGTVRDRLEREARKTRVRVEREARKTRTRVEREAHRTRTRVEQELRRRKHDLDRTAGKVQDRILNLV